MSKKFSALAAEMSRESRERFDALYRKMLASLPICGTSLNAI